MTPLRIAIVGCGAIARAHATAIAATEGARCTVLFDSSSARATALRDDCFPDARVAESFEQIAAHADAAIIAVPNAFHAQMSAALLAAGLHVLCEKPLALSLADAEHLVQLARQHQRVLRCGMVRRHFGSTALVRDALERDLLGRPLRVEVVESVRNWPFARAAFDRALAGGGVFVDMAPHVLDLLHHWLGPVRLISHEDDARGGVEAVSVTHVECAAAQGKVPARIQLYRAHATRSEIAVHCERGVIEIDPRERNAIRLSFVTSGSAPYPVEARRPTADPFATQLAEFCTAACATPPPPAPLEDVVATVGLIEEAYARRSTYEHTWAKDAEHGLGALPFRRVLVTGATGSVGSRLVEMWAAAGRLGQLRCLVRGYRSAARIMRFPVDLAEGDLLDVEAVRRAAEGCDAIVHLGVGDRAEAETRSVLAAAQAHGIRRIVHMSSAAVYGRGMPVALEALQEATPLRKTGEPYADAKAAAERLVVRAAAGLDCVILRPHMVYGPGLRWSAELLELLQKGRVPVIADGGVCNLIFVDDLVRAVDAGLAARSASGRAYFVTDGAPLTWSEYIRQHARAAGVLAPEVRRADVIAPPRTPVRWLADSVRPLVPVVRGEDFRRFVLESPAVQATVFPLYLNLRQQPRLGAWMSRLRGGNASAAPVAAGFDPTWVEMQLSEARLSGGRAREELGFVASIDAAEGIARAVAWSRRFGILPEVSAPGAWG